VTHNLNEFNLNEFGRVGGLSLEDWYRKGACGAPGTARPTAATPGR
jgi:hypothetical protein